MAAVIEQKEIVKGGSFLIEEHTPAEIFTPEDFNEEHRMIAETTRQFMDAEVLPRISELAKTSDARPRSRLLLARRAGLGCFRSFILARTQRSRSTCRKLPRAN